MPLKTGYLDKNGHPNVKIRVWGIDPRFKQEFEAMIDTGFTGFLKLPITMALPLGLTLIGTGDSTLADGSKSPMLLTFGTVELDGQETTGVVALDSGGTPLLGMAFLRQCQHTLMVSSTGVILVDENEVKMIVDNAVKNLKAKGQQEPHSQPVPEANPPLPESSN